MFKVNNIKRNTKVMYEGYNKDTEASSLDAFLVSLLLTFNIGMHMCAGLQSAGISVSSAQPAFICSNSVVETLAH